MIWNLADLPLRYWHLTVKMSSNLADGRSTPVVLKCCWSRWVQVWQIYPPSKDIQWSRWVQILAGYTPRYAGRSTAQYWHLVVKTEFKFGRSTPTSAGRSIPQGLTSQGQDLLLSLNLADLPLDLLADLTPDILTSHGQGDFKFGRSTPLVLKSQSQDEFKFGRSTPLVVTSDSHDEVKFGRSTPWIYPSTDISWSRWVQIWQVYP